MDTRLGPDGTQSPRLPVKKGTINRVNGPVRRSTDDLALFLRVWIVIGQCRQNKTRLSAGFHSKNCGVARPWCNRATCVRRLTPDPNEIFSVESSQWNLRDRHLTTGRSALSPMSLFSGANRPGQSAVIDSICGVPQWLAQFDPSTKHLNLIGASGRCVGRDKLFVLLRDKILVVTVSQDGFKNVPALTHKFDIPHSLIRCVRSIHARYEK